MSSEQFNPERLRGISVNTVFEGNTNIPFSSRLQKTIYSLEQAHTSSEGKPELLYDLAVALGEGIGLRDLAKRFGIGRPAATRLLRAADIPTPSREEAVRRWNDSPRGKETRRVALQAAHERVAGDPALNQRMRRNHGEFMRKRWEDPEFKEHMSALTSQRFTELWQDPEYRARMKAHADTSRQLLAKLKLTPSYRERMSEIQRERWEDPEFRKKISDSTRRNHQMLMEAQRKRREDPAHRELISEALRQRQIALWENEEYRENQVGKHRARWKEPEYRERMLKIITDPNRASATPTIHGYRSDIDFYALSSWEANFARILMLVGRSYITRENLQLTVTDEYRDIFQNSETTFISDFLTTDNRGRLIIYELMAHPLEDPEGWVKIQLARKQYPDLVIRTVDATDYNRLRNIFEERINNDPRFHGWEKYGYNLKTHPKIFAGSGS